MTYFGDASAWDIAADGSYVYWLDDASHGTLCARPGSVQRAPLAGGPTEDIALHPNHPQRLALDGDSVYFTERPTACPNEPDTMPVGGGVAVVPKRGGSINYLAPGIEPFGIAVDTESVYWVEQKDASLRRVPKSGGLPVVLARGFTGGPRHLAADRDHLYVGDWSDGTLWSIAISSGTATLVFQPPQEPPGVSGIRDLALDATHIYFSTFAAVARVRKDGSGYERLADTGSASVAVDDIAYYYGGIIRGCK